MGPYPFRFTMCTSENRNRSFDRSCPASETWISLGIPSDSIRAAVLDGVAPQVIDHAGDRRARGHPDPHGHRVATRPMELANLLAHREGHLRRHLDIIGAARGRRRSGRSARQT